MIIECKNIIKKFDNSLIIKGINYKFEEGKIYGLYG